MQNRQHATFNGGVSDAAGISGILFTSAWVPREVCCRHCAATASLENMDCVDDTEIAVNYICPDCGWHLTQHFHDKAMGRERENRLRAPSGNA